MKGAFPPSGLFRSRALIVSYNGTCVASSGRSKKQRMSLFGLELRSSGPWSTLGTDRHSAGGGGGLDPRRVRPWYGQLPLLLAGAATELICASLDETCLRFVRQSS